jgi:hypothetical protein
MPAHLLLLLMCTPMGNVGGLCSMYMQYMSAGAAAPSCLRNPRWGRQVASYLCESPRAPGLLVTGNEALLTLEPA